MAQARRDANYITTILGVSNADGVTPVVIWADPTTHRLLVDLPGGSGTVTSVSVVTANGVSGTVATPTTTPAITLTLGAITPSAVQVSGLTASEIVGTDASKNLASLAVATYPSLTELTFLKGVTSAIQTQITAKMTNPMTTGGDLIYGGASGVATRLANGTAGQVLQSNGTTLAPTWGAAGVGDMILVSVQTVTGAKTFNDTKFLLRNVANTFNGSFVNTNTADRIYTLKDAAGTLAFTSDITGINSGTNTGDQTITLTGGVTGSGTGSFAATVVTNANLTGVVTSTGNATAIADAALSIAKTSGLQTALDAKEATANKDASGGYAGLTLFKINFKNALNTIISFFTNANTVSRTYTFQDRDGTIADDTDLALKANLASPTFTGTVGGITSTMVGLGNVDNTSNATERAATATLTNKTLTTPTISKPVMSATNPTAQTYTPAAAGTATLDLSLSNSHFITMPAGNITIALSSDTSNQPFIVRILQDATGSRTVTWFATIKWAGGTAPTLTTTASKADTFGFIRTTANQYDGFIVGQNC